MPVTMNVAGEGLSIEREITQSKALKIIEIALEDQADEAETGITVTLHGEGIELDREVSKLTALEMSNVVIHDDDEETENRDFDGIGLPDNFFDRLSTKQRIMLEILLEADGEWIRGTDIRQKMREEYGMDVGEGGRATAGVIAGLTRKYNEEFRRDVIPGRWADETQQHAEFRIGEKYKKEIGEEIKE